MINPLVVESLTVNNTTRSTGTRITISDKYALSVNVNPVENTTRETSSRTPPPSKPQLRPIPHLIALDISHNLFIRQSAEYPESALRDLSELQVLCISGINGATFGEGFKSLIKLSQLNLYPHVI